MEKRSDGGDVGGGVSGWSETGAQEKFGIFYFCEIAYLLGLMSREKSMTSLVTVSAQPCL